MALVGCNGKKRLKNLSGNLATLIIDMQEDFLKNIIKREELVRSHTRLIDYCDRNRIPIIAVEYVYHGKTIEPLNTQIKETKRHSFVEKRQANAFSSPELSDLLKKWKIDNLIITGVNASFCVLDAAETALDAGFGVITAYQLIDDEAYFAKRNKSINWYKENTLYHSNYFTLLKELDLNYSKNL